MARSALFAATVRGTALCQQLAFTSRAYIQCPVVILSVENSKQFGFDSVALRNEGPDAIRAVRFRVTFRTGAGDEVFDERRAAVSLDPRDSTRLAVFLGPVNSLRQTVKTRKQESALVILTIESVEFEDGGEWKQTEQNGGAPYDPVRPLKLQPKK